MIIPSRLSFIDCTKTCCETLKVPRVSISKTLLKPFVLNFSAVARKLPAAPLTRISILPNLATILDTAAFTDSGFDTSPCS